MPDVKRHQTFCRVCAVCCPILIDIVDAQLQSVNGDRSNGISGGYTCVKGRAQTEFYRSARRLMQSMKRMPDGSHQPIPVEQAMDEIATKLERIVAEHGPRSFASYYGTYAVASATMGAFIAAFAEAVGTPMQFSANTVDKPGKRIARAMLGSWMAPTIGYTSPNVGLLIGLNPFISYQGLPNTNPGKWLQEQVPRGFKLIVIDPRRNDAAKRAWLHLQIVPGEDLPVLAAMVRLIIEEKLYDEAFVAENVTGLDELRVAVAPYTIELAAERAGVDPGDLALAARTFATAGRGYAFAGTGPNMSGPGTLNEYLTQSLVVLCGYYLRSGEQVPNPRTFLPALKATAQARPPQPAFGFGEPIRVRGLANTAAGMPTAALPDEILMGGLGRVRALLSCAGNPVAAWPDQIKTHRAMEALDLLVQIDPWMSQTAQVADYIIAPKIGLETPGINFMADFDAENGTGYGRAEAFGQYSPALLEPPPGSELIEEWEFFYGIAQRMQLNLTIATRIFDPIDPPVEIDMVHKPTTDELIELLCAGSRIPLEEVQRHPGGAAFPDPPVYVAPKEPGWTGRLDVGNADMMTDLKCLAGELLTPRVEDGSYDLRLICRRATHVVNSAYNDPASNHGRPWNPAFVHPDDLATRGLTSGDEVRITSRRSSIVGIVEGDATLRPGTVSMTHSYGGLPGADVDYRELGSCTARLLFDDEQYDRYSGQPLMSNVPVRVERLGNVVEPGQRLERDE